MSMARWLQEALVSSGVASGSFGSLPSLGVVGDGPQYGLGNGRGQELVSRVGGEVGEVGEEEAREAMAAVEVDSKGV